MLRYDIDSLDNRRADWVERVCRAVGPLVTRYFRGEVRGVGRVPAGAALYVGNHSSGLITPDSFVLGYALWRERGVDYVPYGLGHELAISLPPFHQIIVPLGAVRASHENAHRLFARGEKVIVYPGGDVDAMRPWTKRDRIVFGGRRGYARLAIRSGVPIVPVVAAGSHETFCVLDERNWAARVPGLSRLLRLKTWPTTLSIPWGITLGPPLVYLPLPARTLIEVLEPMTFERTGDEAAQDEAYVAQCADRVEGTMQAAMDRLYAEVRARRWRPWRRR